MEEGKCSLEQCDIFDFMANFVGLTVIHPGGFTATNKLLEALPITKQSKVLDIGCGKGTTSVLIAKKYGCNVVGIDISDDLVKQAKSLTKRKGLLDKVSFEVGDALEMPFEIYEFDIALGQAVLILVKDKKKAISEAIRVLKPGGHFGWLELSWKKAPTKEFLNDVSNVICAYCMLNVETFENWKKIFNGTEAKYLKSYVSDMEFQGMLGMLKDEGIVNAGKVMYKFLTNTGVRKRIQTLDNFFRQHGDYFSYGIFTGMK